MPFHPPFFVFCALGASVMIVSTLLAIAAEKIDAWLTRQTQLLSSRRPLAQRHLEVSHLL
ncbi:hypothetical protein G3N95_27155 [Paraburkholderia sp. Tr-20389]|uniref:hypothetical protein n=1 Tax=Paraburkholderia sp. Tr-20389 TaxID=2703903 RepID=UPI00197D5358|nr:hypothetical protein [Paraburkholderia sp. Tr-20389]MBN3756643.1 hypothetical protein [Paraburkholderia sp. Tr-20389]